MTEPPLVSVVIPARNAASTIARAVDSVLAQDYRPIEVLVIDDASTDATPRIVAAHPAPEVRLIAADRHRGAGGARNIGIAAARGDIVAFQDADDEWRPGKLRRQVALLLSDPTLVFAACGTRFIRADGHDLGPLFNGQHPAPGDQTWRGLLARNTIATPCVVVWRKHLLAETGFDERLIVAEDQDLWIRLAMRGRLGYIAEPLVFVHQVVGSVSGVGTGLGYRQQIEITMPMVRRHLTNRRGALSARAVRRILGERWGRIGRSAFTYGHYADGLCLILRATLMGFEPLRNVWFLLSAAPFMRPVKRLLRPNRG